MVVVDLVVVEQIVVILDNKIKGHQLMLFHMEHFYINVKILLLLNVQIWQDSLNLIEIFICKIKLKLEPLTKY